MSGSPSRTSAAPHPHLPSGPSILSPTSPRGQRTIRRFQSAQTLSALHSLAHPRHQPPQPRAGPPLHRDFPNSPPAAQPSPAPIQSVLRGRTRSNSDAAVASVSAGGPSPRRVAMARKIISPGVAGERKPTLDMLLRTGPPGGDLAAGIKELRYSILADGVLSDSDGMSSLRIYIWLILLAAPPLSTDVYLGLVHRGPSPAYAKIRNDTFRTLATDPLFRRRVSEASLIRMLNAVAWKLHDAKEILLAASQVESPELPGFSLSQRRLTLTSTTSSEAGGSSPGTYVQGMNVLAAPFLYAARSEAEAFAAFHVFLTRECPGYVRGAMNGVHRGLSLVDNVLALVDPKLSAHLLARGMPAEIYAFASVLTLCACTPPLPEVLHLWDFLFAYGAHLNVLCIVAQLVMIRDAILASQSPMKILRAFPPLQAAKVKAMAISFLRKIPDGLYQEIVLHAK
ncbi:MAG: hypothetical protein M1829_003457 [Trizodia sp. TS-e1964]|nr:MAG: hypothetical protein M1829_003457 [Trizodia sp. TS-e1964]